MVDIHSHILWGLDDGARSFEQSLEMVRIALASGTTDIVATPHANEKYAFEPLRMEEKIAQLRAAGKTMPAIHTGCDLHLGAENVDRAIREPGKYTIAHGRYLLVQCSDSCAGPETGTALERLLGTGLIPVITHPERNPVLRDDFCRLSAWVELGCRMQLTAMSINGGFGRTARSSAWQLLERGLAHFIASEAHDLAHRSPSMAEAFQSVANRFGFEKAQTLFVVNPINAIRGIPIAIVPASAPEATHKWWRF